MNNTIIDNWDVYFCKIDEKPGSIRLNLALAHIAPLPDKPFCGYVSILINAPDAQGFVPAHEFEAFCALEETITKHLAATVGALYAGCCTGDGKRDYFFFVSSDAGWYDAVDAALVNYESYSYESEVYEDAAWNVYFDFLYPTEKDLLLIHTRRTLDYLQQQGVDLHAPRKIEHSLRVGELDMVEKHIAELATLGFMVESVLRPDDGTATDDMEDALLTVYRMDKPAEMNQVSLQLFAIAEERDMEYLGWGAPMDEA